MIALPEYAIQPNTIHHMDLFALCNALPSQSVDMILCDLPYGTTAVAARNTGRNYICGDFTREYVELARTRIQNSDPYQPTAQKNGMKQLSLFKNKSTEEV